MTVCAFVVAAMQPLMGAGKMKLAEGCIVIVCSKKKCVFRVSLFQVVAFQSVDVLTVNRYGTIGGGWANTANGLYVMLSAAVLVSIDCN